MSITGVPKKDAVGSCRQCPIFCERIVYPAGCLESGCSRLYAFEEEGRTYIGCLAKVYTAEIDLELFQRAQRTRAGFGGLRAVGEPLPVCRTEVERTFEHRARGGCLNPDFLLSAPHRPYHVTARPEGAPPERPAQPDSGGA
jgi:hypothetical protein